MSIKIWVLCIGGLCAYGLTLPNQLGRSGGPECHVRQPFDDLHLAAATIQEWTQEHGGDRPLEFNGRYMESWRLHPGTYVDEWTAPFYYERSDDGVGFLVRSLGRDGVQGGDGQDTDRQASFDSGTGTLRYFELVLVVGGPDQVSELQWQERNV